MSILLDILVGLACIAGFAVGMFLFLALVNIVPGWVIAALVVLLFSWIVGSVIRAHKL